jgi:hypothetical protein
MNSISPMSTIPLRFRKSETGTERGLCYPGKRSSVALDLHLGRDPGVIGAKVAGSGRRHGD